MIGLRRIDSRTLADESTDESSSERVRLCPLESASYSPIREYADESIRDSCIRSPPLGGDVGERITRLLRPTQKDHCHKATHVIW